MKHAIFETAFDLGQGKWFVVENQLDDNGNVIAQDRFDEELWFDDEESAEMYCKTLNESVK